MDDSHASPERLAAWSAAFQEYSRDQDPVTSLYNLTAAWRALSGNAAMISVSMRNLEPGQYRVLRFLHTEQVAEGGYENIVQSEEESPITSGGFLGEIVERGEAVVLNDLAVEEDSVLGNRLAPYRLLMAYPGFDDGELTNWLINLHTDPDAVTGAEIENRFIQATLVGHVTTHKRLVQELRKARRWIEREIDEIAELQRSILPPRMPEADRVTYAAFYETYERAGGDFYDVFPVGRQEGREERWGVLIADAAGHGPSAAVVIAMLATLLRSYPEKLTRPGALLEYLNEHLCASSVRRSFVTAFFALVDKSGESMSFACAGHPMPLLKEADGSVSSLTGDASLPLGVRQATRYNDTGALLEPGQTVLLYTDGLSEARAPDGEMLTDEGLHELLAQSNGSAQEILAGLVHQLRSYEAGSHPDDDQTMLVIQVV